MSAYKSLTTDPPSEVIDLEYPLPPIKVYDVDYNPTTKQLEEKMAYVSDKGWKQITLPVYNGLKAGDKIQVIKL